MAESDAGRECSLTLPCSLAPPVRSLIGKRNMNPSRALEETLYFMGIEFYTEKDIEVQKWIFEMILEEGGERI